MKESLRRGEKNRRVKIKFMSLKLNKNRENMKIKTLLYYFSS